ncbi:MAG: helicase C-terminal domain-containing protein, partial [Nanoarchaeota archaeon]
GLFGTDFNEFCKSVVERGECEFYTRVKNKQQLTVEAKKAVQDLLTAGAKHNQELITFCHEQNMCSYEISLALARNAAVIIGDYYYLFNPFVRNNFLAKLEISLEDIILIVDEGHNLPARITDMVSSTLSSITLKNAVMEAKKFGYNGLLFWLQELMRILTQLNELNNPSGNTYEFSKEKLISKQDFISKVAAFSDYDELINELELAAEEVRRKQKKSYLGGIAAFLEAWKGEDAGFARIICEKESRFSPIIELSYTCLDPRIISKEIFSQIHAGVIMSGTLKPTFMYKDILGIERGVEKEYGSPFPVENKLSIIVPETSTKFTLRGDAMYKRIADICSEITSMIPGNVALFFPSYYMRDKISEHIRSNKKLFWEQKEMSKEDKDLFLETFKSEKQKGGILLGVNGANFAEGVDFPGDLLNGVLVVGLPLSRPDLKTKEMIRYYEEKFNKGWDYGYIFPAMSKCIQSAGRCIRSETDKGVVIFLDERFTWPSYHNCLPREGLIVSKDYQRLLKEFFEKINY